MVQGKGLFELVDFKYGSAFQGLYDVFVNEAVNFVQIGRFHRYWINNSGILRVIVVTPQSPSLHPEWCELFQRSDILTMRMLGRRIGYFINEITKDSNTSENLISSNRKLAKKISELKIIVDNNAQLPWTTGSVFDLFCGLHLYRCGSCKRILLKPLQFVFLDFLVIYFLIRCSRCKTMVYCSKACQRNDWTAHSIQCINS